MAEHFENKYYSCHAGSHVSKKSGESILICRYISFMAGVGNFGLNQEPRVKESERKVRADVKWQEEEKTLLESATTSPGQCGMIELSSASHSCYKFYYVKLLSTNISSKFWHFTPCLRDNPIPTCTKVLNRTAEISKVKLRDLKPLSQDNRISVLSAFN